MNCFWNKLEILHEYFITNIPMRSLFFRIAKKVLSHRIRWLDFDLLILAVIVLTFLAMY